MLRMVQYILEGKAPLSQIKHENFFANYDFHGPGYFQFTGVTTYVKKGSFKNNFHRGSQNIRAGTCSYQTPVFSQKYVFTDIQTDL